MKLLFIIDHFGSGGAQRQMALLSTRLAARGHTVEFFIYHAGHRHFAPLVEAASLRVHLCAKRFRLDPRPLSALRRVLSDGGFDAALAYLETPSLFAEIGRLGLGGPPLIVSERSAFPAGPLSLPCLLRQHAHRLADRVVVNSHHQRERMEREFPWMASRLLTIENGIEASPLAALPYPAGDGLELLAVGRIDRGKNAVGLVHALAICRDRYRLVPTVRWAGNREASGDGPEYHATVLKSLESSGLVAQWEWLGARSDVPDLLARHHALIHPSLFEGFSNAVCESMAAGRPFLAGDIGDHARLAGDGATGLLFDPRDPESIASAIRDFAAIPMEQRQAMGMEARSHVSRSHSMERCAERYEDLFREVTGRGS